MRLTEILLVPKNNSILDVLSFWIFFHNFSFHFRLLDLQHLRRGLCEIICLEVLSVVVLLFHFHHISLRGWYHHHFICCSVPVSIFCNKWSNIWHQKRNNSCDVRLLFILPTADTNIIYSVIDIIFKKKKTWFFFSQWCSTEWKSLRYYFISSIQWPRNVSRANFKSMHIWLIYHQHIWCMWQIFLLCFGVFPRPGLLAGVMSLISVYCLCCSLSR